MKNLNLLIVDDSKFMNNTLKSYLTKNEEYQLNISQVFTLKEAKEIVFNNQIDFILLDLILPDGEGEELISEIGINRAKIIVLTSDTDASRREYLFQVGVLDYFSKENPINYIANEIIKLIKHIEENKSFTFLVIDDSRFMRNHIREIFKNRNYNVLVAKDGLEGLEILQNSEIDLILLDLEMPIMSGEKVIFEIRKQDEFLSLPIIILSSTTNKDLIARAIKSGANDFLAKPFSIEELVLKSELLILLSSYQRKLKNLNMLLEKRVKDEVEKNLHKDKMLQIQSRQAQMGEMIGNIAHQWRQPLNALNLVIANLKTAYARAMLDDVRMDRITTKAEKLIQKMSDTIDDFRDFYKPDKEEKIFSLNEVVENTLHLVKDSLKHANIEIDLNINKNILTIGFPNEYSQVIMNIISNAKDALLENKIQNPKLSIFTKDNSEFATLIIKDNGGGIKEDVIDRIFEPYFTTKEQGKGTGIGLYMSKTIIEEHMSGEISIRNIDNGVEFEIKTKRSLNAKAD